MTLSDDIWVKLNGYVDGELTPADARAFELLLDKQAELQDEYRRMVSLKASMGRLQPKTPPAVRPAPEVRRVFGLGRGLIAASAILALCGLTFLGWNMSANSLDKTPRNLHASLSSKAYVISAVSPVVSIASINHGRFDIPDLSGSELLLADVVISTRDDREVIALHYRGHRGCRLTLVAIDGFAADETWQPTVPQDTLGRFWQNKDFHFSLFSSGMDEKRFAAIADFTEADTRRSMEKLETLRMAMHAAYDEARPCT